MVLQLRRRRPLRRRLPRTSNFARSPTRFLRLLVVQLTQLALLDRPVDEQTPTAT